MYLAPGILCYPANSPENLILPLLINLKYFVVNMDPCTAGEHVVPPFLSTEKYGCPRMVDGIFVNIL